MPKGRGAERLDKLTHFDIIEDFVDGEPTVQLVAPNPNTTREDHLLAALASGPKTRNELIISSNTNPYSVDNSLTSLLRAGKIKKIARGTWKLS
jgi:hypothetical protein